ncbi:dihydrofolate reductase family protein [Bombilactobacillus folatiphilus]|uniref:Dihydrofolate reductase family protein n=1 Tax=Bombilactobacillus folatiphilus TaxID=2923362 RepID=A0ABY4PA87_9LACO|nr:dihydrofolate reductase family protein [Bombilactobacillus folatiphilus]UQS82663.1 dihydrofolate reductase family protein [Bombilactobacillus folatiphilus]
MDRSKVIVHMYVSIDGKIDGPYGSGESSRYYSDELFKLSNADGNGRRTIQMYAASGQPDLNQYDIQGIDYTDWIPAVQAETWSVSFDRYGKCGWQQNYFAYNGQQMRAIEVVTKQASKQYLAFLRSMQIPYLVSGKTEFDLNNVLQKLKRYFQIETLALCGGSMIDGVFLQAHLVDEISLVVAPHVSGDSSQKAAFDTLGQFVDDTFQFQTAKKLSDGGVHLLFSKE